MNLNNSTLSKDFSVNTTNVNQTNNLNISGSTNNNGKDPNNFNKKKKRKNKDKRFYNNQIKEDYNNYLETKNINNHSTNSLNSFSNNINNHSTNSLNGFFTVKSPKQNFYKTYNGSKSLNDFKIKELKDSIRKNSSYNIIGDIIINHNSEHINNEKNNTQQHENLKDDNRFTYLIGDDEIDIENYETNNIELPDYNIIPNIIENNQNQNKNKKNNKNKKATSLHLETNEKTNIKFEDIKDLNLKINEVVDYHLINTPFKMMGEEILNEEINGKYKSKIKGNPENNQIIKKLKDIFKKLVYKESKDKPNVSQILLDNEISDDVKIKIIRKYIKFNTEDEVFSDEADKIKIEIKNLIKQKKIRTSDDYEDLGKQIELKNMPTQLKIKLEDMYYRVIGGDQPKLHNLVNNILKLPWEKKTNILDTMSNINTSHENRVEFIRSMYNKLDEDLYGLEETKDSIISWICQKINNPDHISSKYLCLCGPAGVGKTSIVHSISEALKIPYSYISLANIDEPGSLIGHGYTYEGSQCGSIANGMIKNECINGILLFDEIDKAKEKVQNTLLGIFDPLQNTKFRDAYFGEFYLNLSESMMILCLNDLDKINPILKDRLHIVNIPGYSIKEKKNIISKYILPKLEKQYDIIIQIEDQVINIILEKTKHFLGIRQLQMYFIKIYELMILDKYTYKFNFNNNFTSKNIDLLKFNEQNLTYLNMFS